MRPHARFIDAHTHNIGRVLLANPETQKKCIVHTTILILLIYFAVENAKDLTMGLYKPSGNRRALLDDIRDLGSDNDG